MIFFKYVIYGLLLFFLHLSVYLSLSSFLNKKVFDKIRVSVLQYYKKERVGNKGKVERLIERAGLRENPKYWWINTFSVFSVSGIIFICSYIFFINIIKDIFLSIVFCVPIGFLPFFILILVSDFYEKKLEKNLINYVIQLKNQSKISNDIVEIFSNTVKYTLIPLSTYIRQFLLEVNSGVNINISFEKLKNKINISGFRQLISNLEICYVLGGDVFFLLDKTQNIFMKVQEEKNKRNEQTITTRIVLIVLVLMSVFSYFNFVAGNEINFNIMMKSFVGKGIIFLNFFNIWIMLFLVIYVKKVNE